MTVTGNLFIGPLETATVGISNTITSINEAKT
jgi:hypothetical protein